MRRFLAGLLLLALPATAGAQTTSCRVPDRLAMPAAPERAGPSRTVPVQGYLLSLSWSPQFCRGRSAARLEPDQCGQGAGHFGFILHGLWPQGRGNAHPQYCRQAGPVPESVARQNFCAMPSARLQQHQWTKHGACAFARADDYLAAGTGLYEALRFPDMKRLAQDRTLTSGKLAAAFAAANRGIRPDMVQVYTADGGWLREVRICLNKRFRPQPCRTRPSTSQTVRIWVSR